VSDKANLRAEVWEAIRVAGAGRFPGIVGRIPNFVGAEAAAERLASTPQWEAATTIKANPDSPQWPVRTRALQDGKTLYMAVPRLASTTPFWRLDPDRLAVAARKASSIKGAATHGEPVAVDGIGHIDLVVCGSVAVDRAGARLGKGGGFSDLEFAFAVEAGLVSDETVVATTVHPVQLIDRGRIPITEHDFPLDLVVTPDAAIRTDGRLPRPRGVLWEHLDADKIADIPELVRRRPPA
jgi:5-formyltetrahydrofolate cyclo-ligase